MGGKSSSSSASSSQFSTLTETNQLDRRIAASDQSQVLNIEAGGTLNLSDENALALAETAIALGKSGLAELAKVTGAAVEISADTLSRFAGVVEQAGTLLDAKDKRNEALLSKFVDRSESEDQRAAERVAKLAGLALVTGAVIFLGSRA